MKSTWLRPQALPLWLFVAVQGLFWAGLGIAAVRRSGEIEASRRLPPPRNEPLRIAPQFDYDWMVTDEQLRRVLDQLQPRLRGGKPRINYVDHALRFWGADAEFPDARSLSGSEMRELLTRYPKFREQWGEQTPPLLTGSGRDVKVRVREGKSSSSHVDHTLATLAECGTPLDFPIQTDEAQATVKSLLAHALRQFSPNQTEYEWSALIFALYLPADMRWISQEGQDITWDLLAERLMRQRFTQGVCFGNHRLYTLTLMLRIDATDPLWSDAVRSQVRSHLAEATRRLVQTQSNEGFWDGNWSGDGSSAASDGAPSPLGQRILATGHALEWWAMAPEDLHPPRETLIRAAQWLARTIDEMDATTIEKNYTFLTHAGRSLALWRGSATPATWLTAGNAAPPVGKETSPASGVGDEESGSASEESPKS